MKLTGAMTAIATPMFEDGTVDYISLNNLIDFQIENSISAIVAVGTTGESATIDFEEHVSLIEYFVKYVNGRIKVIAGTGANSTIEALELTKSAKDAGADAALLVSPYYNKPTQEGLYLHHKKIADEIQIPQILYNVPSRTACFIEAETIRRLSLHENIIGIKDATGEMNNLEEIKKLCRDEIKDDKFFLYSGDDATSYEFLMRGGHGTISVSSNIVPKLISEMTRLALEKNEEGKKIEIHGNQKLFEGQILIMKINPDSVADIQQEFGLDIDSENDLTSIENLGGIEAIIVPKSRLIGRKYQYFKRLIGGELSLIGLWRRGLKFRFRLSNEIFKVGDVLLIANRGEKRNISDKLELAGLMPLWQREFDIIRSPNKVLLAFFLFFSCLALVIFNYVSIVIAFLICVIAFVSSKLLTGESVYRHIDWPVVILLAAMIPIGNTLVNYGITDSFSGYLASLSSVLDYVWMLVIIMVITMFLSDIINNAATAVIMAPLAISLAEKIGQPIEPFLMTVAIGASCAFLSPIGHQCNTLVMAPGNYKFGDYWKVGLPLEILIILISVPAIIFYWG